MEQIIDGLYLGSDKDVAAAKERGYARLCACKDGEDSHRSMLGYDTMSAPKGEDYYFARKGNVMALNLIDVDDPLMIPDKVIDEGLDFIREMQVKGRKLLVHCNAGHSRSATLVFMYLRTNGELSDSFVRSEKVFRTLYPSYDPSVGMNSHARVRWKTLPDYFKE